jgi:hypothetical protein
MDAAPFVDRLIQIGDRIVRFSLMGAGGQKP